MADNPTVDNGTGTDYVVATDERTIDTVAVHVQRVAPHGAPNMTVGQVTVTNSSTTIIAADDNRQGVTIVNRQTVAVWIDDTTATTSAFRLDPGDGIYLPTSAVVLGITSAAYSASGDAKVHYIATHD
jgi:hypothetical protein